MQSALISSYILLNHIICFKVVIDNKITKKRKHACLCKTPNSRNDNIDAECYISFVTSCLFTHLFPSLLPFSLPPCGDVTFVVGWVIGFPCADVMCSVEAKVNKSTRLVAKGILSGDRTRRECPVLSDRSL